MCGRYVLNAPDDLSERFQLRDLALQFEINWNAAPTEMLPVIVELKEGDREARLMKWGLIPAWARNSDKRMLAPINAKSEGINDKPMFKNLMKRKRCLVPANGFYEWRKLPDGKQPYLITVPDEPTFSLAGLYDEFRGPDQEPVATFTIITTEPNEMVARLHDRMPVILHREDEQEWLDPAISDGQLLEHLLQPYPVEEMAAWPVSKLVNNVRNKGPEVVEPVEIED